MDFQSKFQALSGNSPFPWQTRLYEHFIAGEWAKCKTCSLPTGLGKTAVIPIWLIALAEKPASIPRRLVYVVNRRTVVDQTTNEVETLRKKLQSPDSDELRSLRDELRKLCAIDVDGKSPPLAISTLRGQFADNRQWSNDPTRPAVICGTVDMIGSRLLFSGYGCGFKSKPLQAGFLGQDVLLIHDEAHLEPAFQKLIASIELEQATGERTAPLPWPKLRTIALSATLPETHVGFTLQSADHKNKVVRERIEAPKKLVLQSLADAKKLADEIARLALVHRDDASLPAVIVFVRSVDDATKVRDKLDKEGQAVAVLTGTLRGKERDELVDTDLFQRFLPESGRRKEYVAPQTTVYLVCTSAGEVGVNISADHLVCDLSTFDSMAQRFGRVNRFGKYDNTRVDVVHPTAFDEQNDEIDVRRRKTLELLKQLKGDASPKAIDELNAEERAAAFSPTPVFLTTSDMVFDAWTLTTIGPPLIRADLPGRPAVAPYLHGIAEWEPPVTNVAWREEVGEIEGPALLAANSPAELIEVYPIKPHEMLREPSFRAVKQFELIAKRFPDAAAWIIDEWGAVQVTTIREIADKDNIDQIEDTTVLLPPSVGGLQGGLLNGIAAPNDDVSYDIADQWKDEQGYLRKRVWGVDAAPPKMKLEYEIALDTSDVIDYRLTR